MKIEISNGELVDKWTILGIKLEFITEGVAAQNIQREYSLLSVAVEHIPHLNGDHVRQLMDVNLALWKVEEILRTAEKDQRFDAAFIENARAVYRLNDERARIKRQINEETKSSLVEEKSYD